MIDQGIALSRLRRAATWIETGRANGYVNLEGVSANGDLRTLDLPEAVLLDLVRAGRVACDVSARIYENRYVPRLDLKEVTQKYWRIVEDKRRDE